MRVPTVGFTVERNAIAPLFKLWPRLNIDWFACRLARRSFRICQGVRSLLLIGSALDLLSAVVLRFLSAVSLLKALIYDCLPHRLSQWASQEAKLNLTKINVATVLLLLILLQYINITELFFFLDPLNLFVLKILFSYTK